MEALIEFSIIIITQVRLFLKISEFIFAHLRKKKDFNKEIRRTLKLRKMADTISKLPKQKILYCK